MAKLPRPHPGGRRPGEPQHERRRLPQSPPPLRLTVFVRPDFAQGLSRESPDPPGARLYRPLQALRQPADSRPIQPTQATPFAIPVLELLLSPTEEKKFLDEPRDGSLTTRCSGRPLSGRSSRPDGPGFDVGGQTWTGAAVLYRYLAMNQVTRSDNTLMNQQTCLLHQ